jgi:hypothetical protein
LSFNPSYSTPYYNYTGNFSNIKIQRAKRGVCKAKN